MHSRNQHIATLHRLMAFAQAVHVKRMIETITASPKQTFWIMTTNLLMETATIEWSKVFGAFSENTHWIHSIPQVDHEETRSLLLRNLGMDATDWQTYQSTIVGYRDQMVAHHDLAASVNKYPTFDPALVAAYTIFKEVRDIADQEHLGGIPLSLDRWADGVATHMSVIVMKAFEASAQLGTISPVSSVPAAQPDKASQS